MAPPTVAAPTRNKPPPPPWNVIAWGVVSSLTMYGLGAVCAVMIYVVGPFFYPRTWGLWVSLPYLSYIWTWGRRYEQGYGGDTPWPFFSRNFILFRKMRRYHGMEFVVQPPRKDESDGSTKNNDKAKDEDKKSEFRNKLPAQQYVIAVSPHGSYSDYRVLMDGMMHQILPEETAKKTRALAATAVFRVPLLREVALWTGCVDASKHVANRMLQKGHSLVIIPGGQAEQMLTERGREIVYLKKRRGFVRLALQHGLPILPIYAFGASDLFVTDTKTLAGLRQTILKRLGASIPLTRGWAGLSLCALPEKITMVVGRPLHFPRSTSSNTKGVDNDAEPTEEEVTQAHEKYCQTLRELFDEYKDSMGYGDRELEIV